VSDVRGAWRCRSARAVQSGEARAEAGLQRATGGMRPACACAEALRRASARRADQRIDRRAARRRTRAGGRRRRSDGGPKAVRRVNGSPTRADARSEGAQAHAPVVRSGATSSAW
jgi:hypothetical protein